MKKKKTILDKTIDLVDKKRVSAEEEFINSSDVSNNLSLIERVFPEEIDFDYNVLKNVSEQDFDALIKSLYDGDDQDLVNTLKGAYFVIKNDIGLFNSQIEKLNDFISKVSSLRNDLSSYLKRVVSLAEKVEEYEKLEVELEKSKEEGILDSSTIINVANVLEYDEKAKSSFIDQTLRFNLSNFTALKLSKNEENKVVIEVADLKEMFDKFGYDLSNLKEEFIHRLQSDGNLENIEGVFEALKVNNIPFLQEKRKAKLLTQFLLYSSKELINNVCAIFKEAHIDNDYFTSYIAAFFPSVEEKKSVTHRRKSGITKDKWDQTSNSKEENDNLFVKGLHTDFVKNLEYLTTNFNVDKRTLLERGVKVLNLTHGALLRHIKELELYDYNIHSHNFSISALSASRIMDSTDSFIEVGEERYLRNNSSRLVATCGEIAKRIYAYKLKGIDYHSQTHYGTFKTNISNLNLPCDIPEVVIKSCVPNDVEQILQGNRYKELLESNNPSKISESTLKNPIILGLEEKYKVDDSIYNFDGIIISRRKVLRNFEFLINTPELENDEKDVQKILLVSSINNSLLNTEQIERIDRVIGAVVNEKGVNYGISKK